VKAATSRWATARLATTAEEIEEEIEEATGAEIAVATADPEAGVEVAAADPEAGEAAATATETDKHGRRKPPVSTRLEGEAMASIIPVAKALYLCEETELEGGMMNLFALFNSIRPRQYPHWQLPFACFAQLMAGLGDVAFHIDIRRANDQALVHRTDIRNLHFPTDSHFFRSSSTWKAVCSSTLGLILSSCPAIILG
jgi:hypothetical protein